MEIVLLALLAVNPTVTGNRAERVAYRKIDVAREFLANAGRHLAKVIVGLVVAERIHEFRSVVQKYIVSLIAHRVHFKERKERKRKERKEKLECRKITQTFVCCNCTLQFLLVSWSKPTLLEKNKWLYDCTYPLYVIQ